MGNFLLEQLKGIGITPYNVLFFVISENILQVEFKVYNTGGMLAPCVFEMSTSFHNVTP